MWPFVDYFDLDVRCGDKRWRVDVKDHSSDRRLARQLSEAPPGELLYIVVPDLPVRAFSQFGRFPSCAA